MRDVKEREINKGEGLFRTMAMALIIASLITLAAVFFTLRQKAPEGSGIEYYLPYMIPYGIVNVLIAGIGVYFTTVSKEKPGLYFPGNVMGIVFGGIIALESLPLAIFFQQWEFFVSVLVIGACLIAISIVGIKSLKDD